MDEKWVPAGTVLIEQENDLPRRTDSRARAGCLDLHQGDEAVDLRLLWREPGQDSAETERVVTQPRTHPVIARGRRVALVEDEVDDLKHRPQACVELGARGHLERNAGLGECPLGADDALSDGRHGNEEGSRDLLCRETREQTQRERDTRLGREDRMAGNEHEAQEVVTHVAHDPRQSSDESWGLDPPHRVDRAVCIRRHYRPSPPNTSWITDSPSPTIFRKRLAHSRASSFDFTSISAKPPVSSFVSVKGPSVMVTFPAELRTCVLLSPSPPVASRMPARVVSSMSFPISAMSSGFGGALGLASPVS